MLKKHILKSQHDFQCGDIYMIKRRKISEMCENYTMVTSGELEPNITIGE